MRKTVFIVALILGWAVSAQAAIVYLKDGGTMNARNVWREKGKVVVLLNRESIASFSASEIDMKKTFPPRKKLSKRPKSAVTALAPVKSSPAAAPAPTAVKPDTASKRLSLPTLPGKLPERELPKGTEEGAIRKQKREMQERIGE